MSGLIFKQTPDGGYKICITGSDGFDVCVARISKFNPLSSKDRELFSDMQSLGIQAQRLSFKLAGLAPPPPTDNPTGPEEKSPPNTGPGSLNHEFAEKVKRQQFTNVQFDLFVETLQKVLGDIKGLNSQSGVDQEVFSPDPTFRFEREPYAMMNMTGIKGWNDPEKKFYEGTKITVSSNGGSDTHLEIANIYLPVGPELQPIPGLEDLVASLSRINTVVGLNLKARVDLTIYPTA